MLLDVAPVEIRALAWGAIMHPILYTIPQNRRPFRVCGFLFVKEHKGRFYVC